jgi:hypothetical protein
MRYFSIGDEVEVWFYIQMQNLRMTDYTPIALTTVKRVLRQCMPSKAKQGEDFLDNPESVDEWLDKVLKIDCMLNVEQDDGTPQRIAVDITGNASEANKKFDEIMQRKFWVARKELNIDRHWIVLVNPDCLPSRAELIDVIYAAVDDSQKCVMINLWKP